MSIVQVKKFDFSRGGRTQSVCAKFVTLLWGLYGHLLDNPNGAPRTGFQGY